MMVMKDVKKDGMRFQVPATHSRILYRERVPSFVSFWHKLHCLYLEVGLASALQSDQKAYLPSFSY
jgi:hypothetical protein